MNASTIDPPKVESTVETIPIQPSAPTLTVAPAPVSASAPIYPYYGYQYYPPPYYPYQQAPLSNVRLQREKINDWLAWSVINIFLGGIIFGIIPLIFSLICRSKKQKNEINGARKMSALALIFNIIVTILGIAAAVAILVYFFYFSKTFKFIH